MLAYLLPCSRPKRRRLIAAELCDPVRRERFAESLTAIGIVGLLVALAASGFPAVVAKVQTLEAESLARLHLVDAMVDRAAAGRFADRELANGPLREPLGKFVATLDWAGGELVAGLAGQAAAARAAASTAGAPTIVFRPATTPASGATVWLCGTREPPLGFAAAAAVRGTLPAQHALHFCRGAREDQ